MSLYCIESFDVAMCSSPIKNKQINKIRTHTKDKRINKIEVVLGLVAHTIAPADRGELGLPRLQTEILSLIFKKKTRSWKWWCTPVIKPLGRLRQGDHKLETTCKENSI